MLKYLLILLLTSNILLAQSSFLYEVISQDHLSFPSEFRPAVGGGGSFLSLDSDGQISLLDISGTGAHQAHWINFSGGNWFPVWYQRNASKHAMTLRGQITAFEGLTSLVVYDEENGIYWAKKLGITHNRLDFCFFLGNKVYTSHFSASDSISSNKLGLAVLDELGNELWGYYYKNRDWLDFEVGHYLAGLDRYMDGEIVALVYTQRKIYLPNEILPDLKYGNALIRFDSIGNIIKAVGVENDKDLVAKAIASDNEGNIFVAFKWSGNNDISISTNGIIVKFNPDLEMLWAKELYAENFPCSNISLAVNNNNDVIFTYVTNGNLPVIAGKISGEGEIIDYQGLSFYKPKISIADDNSVYYLSRRKYFTDGTYDDALMLAKTDPQGNIEACPQFEACLELIETSLDFEIWEWNREEAPLLEDIPVSIEPSFSFQTAPHCGTPLPPRADFALPDTICQGECIFPDSVYNRLAHQVEWHIQGVDLDTVFSDSIFNWCFDIPGEYAISQEVWLLGCSEYFEENLTVLPDDLHLLSPLDYELCQDPPFPLSIEANRALNTYLWEDGSQEAVHEINHSGEYFVTISDGYCESEEQISLTFLGEYLGEELLILPADTFVCADDLPYRLVPFSPISDSFIMNGVDAPKEVFYLNEAGTYMISLARDSCTIFRTFTLDSESCDVPVYYPNSFSPNDDGINDYFEFFGNDYMGIQLEIYDRWGGQVFETDSSPFVWDGKSNDKKADIGVYIFLFQYRNEKNGKTYQVSGDVLLIK